MLNGIRIEICAGSPDDVRTASAFREIDRIELNSHLELDGLTPGKNDFLTALKLTRVPVFPMVRVKSGPFTAGEEEKKKMLEEADFFLKNGAGGIVFGILNQDGSLDGPFTAEMIRLIHSYQKEAVFHKAFDVCSDKEKTIRELIAMHADRILTSGGMPSSKDGGQTIAAYQQKYGNQIQFQPAGGISSTNVAEILTTTGCTRFHMSLRSEKESPQEKIRNVLTVLRGLKTASPLQLTGEDLDMLKDDRYEEDMMK